MNGATLAGVSVVGGIALLGLLLNLRANRLAKLAIEKYLSEQRLRGGLVSRQWIKTAPFTGMHRNKSIFRVRVTDNANATYVVWTRFEHDLFGNVCDSEIKFEHADR